MYTYYTITTDLKLMQSRHARNKHHYNTVKFPNNEESEI